MMDEDVIAELTEQERRAKKHERRLWWANAGKAVWHIVKTLVFIAGCAIFALLLSYAAAMPSPEEKACARAGGHYDPVGVFSAPVCWAADGRTRLFPEGWR